MDRGVRKLLGLICVSYITLIQPPPPDNATPYHLPP